MQPRQPLVLHLAFDEHADHRLFVGFAPALPVIGWLWVKAQASRFGEQQLPDDECPHSRFPTLDWRCRRVVLNFARDHIAGDDDTIDTDHNFVGWDDGFDRAV